MTEQNATTTGDHLWTNIIVGEVFPFQDKMNEELNLLTRKLKAELTRLLGGDEANALLTTISSAGELASLAPLVSLARLRSGELGREEYLQRYGHRGPRENGLAEPRLYEDPGWLDTKLAEFARSPMDVAVLLEKRDAEFEAVRERITRRLSPKQAREIVRRIDETVETNTLREATRAAAHHGGDATTRLKTDDQVRVDGGRGVVEILGIRDSAEV